MKQLKQAYAVLVIAVSSQVAFAASTDAVTSGRAIDRSAPRDAPRRVEEYGVLKWVYDMPEDLTEAVGVELDFLAENLEDFDEFKVSFKSGTGSYVAAFDPGKPDAWNHVVLKKSDAWLNSGAVEGWGAVKTVAVHGQRDAENPKPIRVANVRAVRTARPEIVVVRGDTASNAAKHSHFDYSTCAVTKLLERLDAPVLQMSDRDLSARE